MYRKYYSRFLQAHAHEKHYASHSHHYWPDVTLEATIQYWNDSAQYVDDKWLYFFETKIPQTQKLIAEVLNFSYPEQIVFAPNTHELITRLLSALPSQKTKKILTTDSEFYSFDRQITRLSEENDYDVIKVAVQPFASFTERFIAAAKSEPFDLIYVSQVFFNTGFAITDFNSFLHDLTETKSIVVIDGYHAFMALPTDLSQHKGVFYLAGAYKYAQGGEGCCFMTVPKGSDLRPANTGWFAGIQSLSDFKSVDYPNTGQRFAGSTMDFTALYRLHAVLDLFKQKNITVIEIHTYIQSLQRHFIEYLKTWNHPDIQLNNLVLQDLDQVGHFLTFSLESVEHVQKTITELKTKYGVITDSRGTHLRFGFGLYQNKFTIE